MTAALPTILNPTVIIILLVIIIVPILTFFIVKWVKQYRQDKGVAVLSEDSEVLSQNAYAPPKPPKTNETRIGVTAKEMSEMAWIVKDSIHWVGDDDIATILTQIKKCKTAYDWQSFQDMLTQQLKIKILDVLNKGLTPSQKESFAKWQKNLPVYIKK